MGTTHRRSNWASQGRRHFTNSADRHRYHDAVADQYIGATDKQRDAYVYQYVDSAEQHRDADQYVGPADEHTDEHTDEHADANGGTHYYAAAGDQYSVTRPMLVDPMQ